VKNEDLASLGILKYTIFMITNSFEAFQAEIKKKKILQKYGLKNIGVFGSFARGEAAHDIDIYLDIENIEAATILKLKEELEKLSHKEIDLVLKKYANPIILHRAQRDMRYVTE
jgi:predicted nucleotidyltransferase